MVRLRIKGKFKLNREPHGQIQGWDFFHMNELKVDWADAADTARRQLHGNTPTPESERRYEQVLRERAERELAEKKAQAAASRALHA